MSKATIVSFCPIEIEERRPRISPVSVFRIPASDGKIPQLLVVEDAYFYEHDPNRPRLPPRKEYIPGEILASSIVYDFKNSIISADSDSYPAVFSVTGTPTIAEISNLPIVRPQLEAQKRWLVKLVKEGDDEWQNSNHKHRAITDLHRIAAQQLGLDREYTLDAKNIRPEEVVTCGACKKQIHPQAVVCEFCGLVVKPAEYAKLQFIGKS